MYFAIHKAATRAQTPQEPGVRVLPTGKVLPTLAKACTCTNVFLRFTRKKSAKLAVLKTTSDISTVKRGHLQTTGSTVQTQPHLMPHPQLRSSQIDCIKGLKAFPGIIVL